MNEFVNYTTSSLSAKDAENIGKYELFDANSKIGYTNEFYIDKEFITIIKDGAGVGRTRILPKGSAFIGTMGAITEKESDINFVFALLNKIDFNKRTSGSTIPHIYFRDYGIEKHYIPESEEQTAIGAFFRQLDELLTLHQRKLDDM